MVTIQPTLFGDVEDLEVQPRVRDMSVGPVSVADVQEFSARYHYTRTGGNALWRWGLWHAFTLHGVIAYNLPTRDVCQSVFGVEHVHRVWHMGRLVLSDRSPHNSESRLIGGSLREIRRRFPQVWAIVTYADTSQGHIGYVYQATNALYTGTGGDPIYWVDQSGARHSTYYSGHVDDARGAALGWTKHRGQLKHRYLYVLGDAKQRAARRALLRWPVLPYPKQKEEATT